MEMRQVWVEEELLINRLKDYGESHMYPFHMPGHKRLKRGTEGMEFPNPFSMDITEIEGFDNLHHPEGILKRSMERAAESYGADKTFYLVNGSSSGILAAICGTVSRGGRILMSRNCHKAAYHAAYINQLDIHYVYPQPIDGLGIQGGILASDVEKILEMQEACGECGDKIQAVFVVSPTYDGVVSDIEGIAKAAHRAGIPLIVDEAHGAHFRYGESFPQSALELGADVVIQSVHKTLPSLTQTALLHMKANGLEGEFQLKGEIQPESGFYGNPSKIERYLHIYQSSSPSYVLMASIENSIYRMEQMGSEIRSYEAFLYEIREELSRMKKLSLVGRELVGRYGVYDLDCTKIVVSVRGTAFSGEDLSRILREKYHLEMEMCGADYVTAITTVMDDREGLIRLKEALLEIDGECLKSISKGENEQLPCIYSRPNEAVLRISEALDGKRQYTERVKSEGRISGEFVYIYPPGIPILAPGERISRSVLDTIQDYIEKGLPVQGLEDESLRMIWTVEEKGL